MINGIVTLNGQPLPNQEIQLLDEEAEKILASTISEPDGSFNMHWPEKPVSYNLIFKIRYQNLIGAWCIKIKPENTQNLHLNLTDKDFVKLNITLKSETVFPEHLNVFADPIQLEDFPMEAIHFLRFKNEKISSSYYFRQMFSGQNIELRLKKGIYNLGGEYVLHDQIDLMNNASFVVSKARMIDNSSIDLPGNQYLGFRVPIEDVCRIEMDLNKYKE